MDTEEQQIIDAFSELKEAILAKDWTKAIHAYFLVSGEQLEQESKLERIRKGLKTKNSSINKKKIESRTNQ